VLCVGHAHTGEFGGLAAIARAKGELPAALPPGGVALLNADDPLVLAMAERTAARVVTFGVYEQATVRAVGVTLDTRGRAGFTLVTPQGSAPVRLRLVGAHNVVNALAAAALAAELGLGVAEAADGLSTARPRSRWRMEVTERPDGVTVINDAYNANPDSMAAGLKALAAIANEGGEKRRSWAVLGEMAELGDDAISEHDRIGRLAVRLDVSRLIVVGTGRSMSAMHHGAVMEGSWGAESTMVADADAALALLRAELQTGDVVLVKASNAARLGALAESLVAEDPQGSCG
jgi:UDP-N-acetylmuramoyl-tripeptide--D-alanyl-D-alanine ligase